MAGSSRYFLRYCFSPPHRNTTQSGIVYLPQQSVTIMVEKQQRQFTTTCGNITIYQGDLLQIMPEIDTATVDGFITDPPYSSGGFTRSDKAQDPTSKYCQSDNAVGRPTFTGDNRDARSFFQWSALWLIEAARIVKPAGYAMLFTDWRQLPMVADALQVGGFVWRGIAAWDKGRGARAPHKGYFRHQCEYIVWGTNGPCPQLIHDGPFDGCYKMPTLQADKFHMTGKPTPLMRELVRPIIPGGIVLDPFAGSGTTLVAARDAGLRAIGIEKDPACFDIAVNRLKGIDRPEQDTGADLFGSKGAA